MRKLTYSLYEKLYIETKVRAQKLNPGLFFFIFLSSSLSNGQN